MPDISIDLKREARSVEIRGTGITLRAPGLQGRATFRGLRIEGEVRAAEAKGEPDPVDLGLAEIGGLATQELVIDARTPEVARPEGTRAGEGELANDEVAFEVPSARDEYAFVIYRDEDGVLSIHFPMASTPGETAITRSAGDRKISPFRIRLRQASGVQPEGVTTRGWGLATKVFKFVVGKIVEKIAGRPVGYAVYGAAWVWESTARKQQGFHGGDLNALLAEKSTPVTEWKSLENKRSLLLIHGTTSTTAGAFAGWKDFSSASEALYRQYENRVIGFNHHTLTKRVARNVIEFYEQLPKGQYEFDVLCHSRGGLVARVLKELTPSEIARLAGESSWSPTANVKVGRIVFVGTPNYGTALADPNNIPGALNRLANISTLVPGAGLSIAGVLSWAAYVAEAGFKALPGLADMCPGSDLLLALNHPSPATVPPVTSDYFAIQSNYTPDRNSSLGKVILDNVANTVVDRLFKNDRNDLIVPTLGVSRVDEEQLDAGKVKYFGQVQSDNVAHTRYFQEKDTWSHVLQCLLPS